MALVACSGPDPLLEVDQFHLRDTSQERGLPDFEIQVVDADRMKHLHGAVTAQEREDRLGDYYSIRWHGPAGGSEEPVRIVFQYRQGSSGRTVRTMERTFPAAEKGGCEFEVVGQQFRQGGRVLAWRVDYYRGSRLVAKKQSYLWE